MQSRRSKLLALALAAAVLVIVPASAGSAQVSPIGHPTTTTVPGGPTTTNPGGPTGPPPGGPASPPPPVTTPGSGSSTATTVVARNQSAANRLKAACARIPNLTERTNGLLTRLPAGPDTHGSIAWVQAKANDARQRNMENVATDLDNRSELMTRKLATLPNQLALLQKVQSVCVVAGESA